MDTEQNERESYKKERMKILGYHPQQEIHCNRYLPYSHNLDDESQKYLKDIKENFARAIAMREMDPGIREYTMKLLTYIKLYGLKFSKEDHIHFIKIFLELITIPKLEPTKVNSACQALIHLLKKTKLISPAELEIDWKPLFTLSKIVLDKTCTKGDNYRMYTKSDKQKASTTFASLLNYAKEYGIDFTPYLQDDEPQSLDHNLQSVIQLCTPYFSKDSTKEILEEIYPRLQPLDVGKSCPVFEMLSFFLNPYEGYELWFDEFMSIWTTYQNPPWSSDMMNIMADLASRQIGCINWEPHIPIMFTRILRSIDLPVSYKCMKSSRNQGLYTAASACWIVSVLGPNSSGQKYLNNFMGTIESYLHPANSGKWVNELSQLLLQIPKQFFNRLIAERYRKTSWERPIPESEKLTEECITAFVECMKPVAFRAMYSRISTNDVSILLKHLADLRPELIIPGIIERVYSTLDSLTEPHKMTAALHCLVGVSRSLVSGHKGYTAGKTHIIPILFATLPGIDSNDFKKTTVTLHFITSLSLLIPIVDCSKAGQFYDDLTEEERLICEQTAEFEDFVLQYLDRIFVLIEASAVENIRMEQQDSDNIRTRLESVSEAIIHSCTNSVILQCSKPILASASRKVIDYIKTHIIEPKVAGPIMAAVLRVFARAFGDEILKSLVPYLTQQVNTIFDDIEDLDDIDKQSDEVIYYLILLVKLARTYPKHLIPYLNEYILPTTDRLFKLKCKSSNKAATNIIGNILHCLSVTHSSPYDVCPLPLEKYLPIRHWGEKVNPDEKIEFIIPDELSRQTCEEIVHRYLLPILNKFELYNADKTEMNRDELNRDLSIILCLLRCHNLIPNWEEEPLEITKTETKMVAMQLTLGIEDLHIKMPDGSNILLAIIKVLNDLQTKLLTHSEDDIKSLKSLTHVWDKLVIRKHSNGSFDLQLKNFLLTKQFQEFRLQKSKIRDLRPIHIARILMQQDCRDELSQVLLTKTHLLVAQNLFKLSISRYSAIRILAQQKLFVIMTHYSNLYKLLVDDFVKILQSDSNENHDSFKGVLCMLVRNRNKLVCKNDWEFVQKIWIALLKSQPSEKLSIVKLIDMVISTINEEFATVTTELEISDECVNAGLALLGEKSSKYVSEADIVRGKDNLMRINEEKVALYNSIINRIVEIFTNDSLHWRYNLMASTMVSCCLHPFTKYPTSVANLYVHNLIHESIKERKHALRIVNVIIKQQKRKHIKVKKDPFNGNTRPPIMKLQPGLRDDNEWLQYESDKFPKNQVEWDEPRYIYKCMGYFDWPTDLMVYAPSAQQPKLDRNLDEMNDVEKILFNFFKDKSNVDKLLTYWCLEEKKGKDKFNRSRFLLIKYICCEFGDTILEHFLPSLQGLIEAKTIEGNHRCAAQIMAGMMRGAKHWPYDKTARLYEQVVPLVRLALDNITVESDVYWGTCFATAVEIMDPIKQYWLHEVLLEEPLRQNTSFVDCSRLYCLQGAFNQHVWRMNSYAKRLLDYLRPYLNHQFQNVRERIGSTMINIFEGDLHFAHNIPTNAPSLKMIVKEIYPKLEILLNEDSKRSSINLDRGDSADLSREIEDKQESEYDVAIRLFKTVAQWLVGVLNKCTNGNEAEYFQFLGHACRLERSENDVELAEICSSLLAMLSQALTLPGAIEFALLKVEEVSKMPSWSARLAVIDILQVIVFHNMAIILSEEKWIAKVQDIVLTLLEDTVLEVREKAAEVLGGLIHCSFLSATDKLLDIFKKKCKTKVLKRRAKIASLPSNAMETDAIENHEANAVRIRHTGVLGLCAFISAYPYDVPDFVPNVFEHLGAHLNDPQPIPSTIRKTMGDFKRTHHDNWEAHQLKFTEDQLAVLSDLTVPPSYYA